MAIVYLKKIRMKMVTLFSIIVANYISTYKDIYTYHNGGLD